MVTFFYGVLVFCVLLLGVLLFFIVRLSKALQATNQSLADIAKSQRIISGNPKDFEETKLISRLKKDGKSPFQ